MPGHMAYLAEPKTYYYFRPYNYLHIEQQQAEAGAWGADPGLPYSNEIFDAVFAQFEEGVEPPISRLSPEVVPTPLDGGAPMPLEDVVPRPID
ncbi:hypothetical protein Pla8534_71120 [Lignipirellula cremea]|uniref:Uncharacterized protein n=2 Tax=Lignipirellula cremea TaxID=2528010 RepID=A0A518E530_9BACT|nr:hypothetical protein Pla8534_71120 [Lignipirellula cremea]